MGRLTLLLLLMFVSQTRADPRDAVVRIPSHGISATIIHTEAGRTLLLGCAHGYCDEDRWGRLHRSPTLERRPMTVDVPAVEAGAVRKPTGGKVRLLRLDLEADLSLVEIPDGPLPYVCPVAAEGFRPGRNLYSVGYDEMRSKVEVRTTIASTGRSETITHQPPWHGRSGGALLDLDAGRLIGVVRAYIGSVPRRPERGVYASHAAILRFLGQGQGQAGPRPPALRLPAPGGQPNCPT